MSGPLAFVVFCFVAVLAVLCAFWAEDRANTRRCNDRAISDPPSHVKVLGGDD